MCSFELDRHGSAFFFLSELRTRKAAERPPCSPPRKTCPCHVERPASNPPTYQRPCTCARPAASFLPSTSRRPLSLSSSFLLGISRRRMLLLAWTRFVLAVAYIHRAGSPFFQILHILSTSTYASLSISKRVLVFGTSHATSPSLRDVSPSVYLSQLPIFFSDHVSARISLIFKRSL